MMTRLGVNFACSLSVSFAPPPKAAGNIEKPQRHTPWTACTVGRRGKGYPFGTPYALQRRRGMLEPEQRKALATGLAREGLSSPSSPLL